MSVDLKKKLAFPNHVQATFEPDNVIWSNKEMCLVIIDLTVLWENRSKEAFERKTKGTVISAREMLCEMLIMWFYLVEQLQEFTESETSTHLSRAFNSFTFALNF